MRSLAICARLFIRPSKVCVCSISFACSTTNRFSASIRSFSIFSICWILPRSFPISVSAFDISFGDKIPNSRMLARIVCSLSNFVRIWSILFEGKSIILLNAVFNTAFWYFSSAFLADSIIFCLAASSLFNSARRFWFAFSSLAIRRWSSFSSTVYQRTSFLYLSSTAPISCVHFFTSIVP